MATTHRWAAAVLVAGLSLGAAACGSDNSSTGTAASTGASTSAAAATTAGGSGQGVKIGLLLPENKTARYENQDKPLFEKAVKAQCPDCQVLYANAQQDPAKQQQQAEQMITNGAKALVIDAVDVQAAGAIANNAKAHKVPVVSYARLIAGAPLDAYVSIDPYKVGVQQGKALVAALKGKPQTIVMINGSPTDSNAAPYKKGAHSVIDKAGIKVVKEYDTPDWSPDKAQTEMEQAITGAGKNGFSGVYSANDGMAGGAIAAMKSAGIAPASRPTTGQDAEVAGLQRILAGDQLMTVYQPIPQIAATAAKLAVPLAQGQPLPAITTGTTDNGAGKVPSVLLDTVAITKDNIQNPIISDGFATAAQICTKAYQKACTAAGIR
ncbi:MAG: putative sugar transporter, substrate-binding protein [Solirubrobacterales bacterium]|jgi:D-xylose transport system substrate-binding protein|nr:putative sugar transporter, substrate-binding protein [Solirubrobacterales bacterium]